MNGDNHRLIMFMHIGEDMLLEYSYSKVYNEITEIVIGRLVSNLCSKSIEVVSGIIYSFQLTQKK